MIGGHALFQEIATLVESASRRSTNPFGDGIWSHHTVHVVQYAQLLARRLGADEEIVTLAALLHDYAAICDKNLRAEHHLHGARLAEETLCSYAYPEERIAQVTHCILSHRASVSVPRDTLEAEVVASADAMAHFTSVASLLHFAFAKRGLSVEEGSAWVLAKLARSWEKLMPEAQELVRERYDAIRIALSQ
jgi:uncharacterized protein